MEIFYETWINRDNAKKFISTLSDEDLKRAIITEDAFESDDPAVRKKFIEHIKARIDAVGKQIKDTNAQLRVEHPEYFE